MKSGLPKPDENSPWPQTDWSGLGRAAGVVGKDAEQLNHLILRYHVPLRIYFLSNFASLKSQAEELLQEFAQDRMLREGWLGKADRNRGRFRDFLKISLRNFVTDRLRKEANPPASLDELELDPPAEEANAELFDLNWARIILAETLERMEQDCMAPGKEQPRRSYIWQLFQFRILQPILGDAEPLDYEQLVRRLDIKSPREGHFMLATAKRIFVRHLSSVIAEYEKSERAVKIEIEEIKRFLSSLAEGKKKKTAQQSASASV